jgi:hypothetical protein
MTRCFQKYSIQHTAQSNVLFRGVDLRVLMSSYDKLPKTAQSIMLFSGAIEFMSGTSFSGESIYPMLLSIKYF